MEFKSVGPKNTPDDVDPTVYGQLIANGQCVNFLNGRCGPIPCSPHDENGFYKVEVDHICSRHSGGSSDADNLQLLCPSANRNKYINPDPNYAQSNFFDQPIDVENLRDHQRMKAFNLVRFDHKDLFENPQQLMRIVLLLGWMVGSGKTIGMLSALFAYNQVRLLNNSAAKRAKRVLWMVHQTTLVKSLKHELETDPVNYGIIKNAPRVEVVEEGAHWAFEADIVVACPQALWPTKGRELTDREIAEILARFEVIVIDEGHFAIDRYLQIMNLAPHALKFAITATPMDADGNLLCELDNGKYKDRFALLSSFSYAEGREQGIFKLLSPFGEGLNKQYHPINGGMAEVRKGDLLESVVDTTQIHNIVRGNGVIGRAIQEAKIEDELTDCDNHIMIRVGSIAHAKEWLETLNKSHPDGFFSSAVWSGSKGKKLGDPNHPWMLVKKNNGRVIAGSTRIVITVDIGQFGVNNKYCSVIAWVDTVNSLIEIIQRIGRALRALKSLGTVRLVWNARDKDFSDRLNDAIDYMLNMDSRLEAFNTLDNIAISNKPIVVNSTKTTLPPVDIWTITRLIGGKSKTDIDTGDILTRWGKEKVTPLTSSQIDRGKKLIDGIKNDDRFKDRIFPICESLEFDGSAIVQKELPPENYSTSMLVYAVESGILGGKADKKQSINLLKDVQADLHIFMTDMVTGMVQERDRKIYAVPTVTFKAAHVVAGSRDDCDKLGFESYSLLLYREISEAIKAANKKELGGICRMAAYTAAKKIFGLRDFKRTSYQSFEPQLVNALLHPSVKRALFNIARPIIIDQIPAGADELKLFFKGHIAKVRGAIDYPSKQSSWL